MDASAALVELARARVPEAELLVGDLQSLPYPDDAFDVVAGFNAFFFADDMVAALREAGRVARPGAAVVIQVWGAHGRNSLDAIKPLVRPLFPGYDPEAPPPPDGPSRSHGVRNISMAPISMVPPTREPARAYPVHVSRPPSLLKALLPAVALLALAIAVTLLDRAYATSSGTMLAFGPLRASWLGAGCFVAALAVGVSSVWRSLD